MDLARAHANLKRLHELPAASYESTREMALAYLRAGCEMFGFRAGAIRGNDPIVYDPEGVLELPDVQLEARSLNGHGQVIFAGPRVSGEDSEILDLLVADLSRELSRLTVLGRLSFEARHDQLTGLPNRFHFMNLFETALQRARHGSEVLALLFLDLDRFKQVNDTLGHAIGDRILQEVAARLKCLLPSARDVVARMAGDEFMVVLTGLPDRTEPCWPAPASSTNFGKPIGWTDTSCL